jgi:glycosyltransferase involved in cell wall biosynthesis
MNRGIEVAICTHNGAGRLQAVFRALSAQTLDAGRWSVLVVDNASTDGTGESARRSWPRADVALRVLQEPRPGVRMARQRALAEASRELICFCDDDNLLAPDYLEQAVKAMEGIPLAGILGGRGEPEGELPLPEWFGAAAPGYAVGPQGEAEGRIPDSRGHVYGAGMVVRRSAWEQTIRGGFEMRLLGREGSSLTAGEDNEICLMMLLMGWQVHYTPRLVFRHLIPARRLDEGYCRALYRGFGEAAAVLNAYRDFLLGRATSRGWRLCAFMRLAQSWWARAVDRVLPRRKLPLSEEAIRREIAAGFVAGCRKHFRSFRLVALYGEIAAWLASEAEHPS